VFASAAAAADDDTKYFMLTYDYGAPSLPAMMMLGFRRRGGGTALAASV
jgi:hypothetical protein